jgi:hypothetical protein
MMGYVLTDAEIDRLYREQHSGQACRSDDYRCLIRRWFATLPVVSREAAERAPGPMTDAEHERYVDVFRRYVGCATESRKIAFDAAPAEPPKSEPTSEPQPAIDVAAELAEIRREVESLQKMHGNHRSIAIAQGDRIAFVVDRITALESTARPWWRWW